MGFWSGVLRILDSSMPTPQMYGVFHLAFFVFFVALGVFLCVKYKNPEEKTVRRFLLISSLVVIFLEIYKQVNFSFSYEDGITFDYQWYAFPFQFCSTPMFVGLLAGLLKKGKLRDALCTYLATFATFAGICVMFYPATVFVETIGINIQTMICHGVMVTTGIFFLGSNYIESKPKIILKAIPVFAVLVCTAMVLNEIAFRTGLLETETFNMFFISPYCEPSLPVYSLVQAVVPFPWCTFIYIAAFTLASFVILMISYLLHNVFKKEEVK